MPAEGRRERLIAELAAMRQLADATSIMCFEAVGEAPEVYQVHFTGTLISRESSVSPVVDVKQHACDIRLPYGFPEAPPDIRFTTAVYHPNISAGGFVDLKSLGLEWNDELTLTLVCERLWDACRLAVYDLDRPSNLTAGQWVRQESDRKLPIDNRPLRDLADKSCSNVVRYKRRHGQPSQLNTSQTSAPDIFYIGEDTPSRGTDGNTGSQESGDIFFIGEDGVDNVSSTKP